MVSKKTIWKGVLSVLVCILIHAIYDGIYFDYYKVYGLHNGHYSFFTYLYSIFIAFLYITIYGYWLLYILALLLFKVAINYLDNYSYATCIGIGITISITSGLFFLMFEDYTITAFWSSFPSSKVVANLPLFILLGGIYGYVYRRWLLSVDESN